MGANERREGQKRLGWNGANGGHDASAATPHEVDVQYRRPPTTRSLPSPMATKDTLLSLDLGFTDCLYRIRREEEGAKRVIYVVIKDLDIIPEESRTCGTDLIRELSKLKAWYKTWDTLTVYRDNTGIQTEHDMLKPHALSKEHIVGSYQFFDILELRILQSLKTRVFRIEERGRTCILKIARFGFELRWLAQEIEAYHILSRHNSTLAPRILGYAFEGTRYRVIGFILEEVIGRRPGITDLGTCKTALQQLHDLDIIHGDINQDNIFITGDRPKFIDFEDSSVGPTGSMDWNERKAQEMLGLAEKLRDTSGKGRPWNDSY